MKFHTAFFLAAALAAQTGTAYAAAQQCPAGQYWDKTQGRCTALATKGNEMSTNTGRGANADAFSEPADARRSTGTVPTPAGRVGSNARSAEVNAPKTPTASASSTTSPETGRGNTGAGAVSGAVGSGAAAT